MTDTEQRKAAKEFAEYWKGKGYEKGQSQPFWLALLRDVYGIEKPEQFITFEDQVHIDSTGFIDGYIPSTKVMIEQKSLDKDLNKPIKQANGAYWTPFQQARNYAKDLPLSMHPRWVVTCNFGEFYVYDMEHLQSEPEKILLANLEKEYYRLQFLVDSGNDHLKREMEISIKAGDLVGVLYDLLLPRYKDPKDPQTLHSLNALCVRLVFCLYAEDAGIFGAHGMFHDYLRDIPANNMRRALSDLFQVLDQKEGERDRYLQDDNPKLAAFPYVNGGLFSNENIEIPPFTDEIKEVLLSKASEGFDWSEISPTIFGAVFESTLNPETRRSGGMHYTSIENIHKVIDPLFLNDLRKELDEIKSRPNIGGWRTRKLVEFKDKLASLTFLDPACGSGNFLTETYLSIRRLENEVIREFYEGIEGQTSIGGMIDTSYLGVKVSTSQFYGIEINDFAVSVAKTALWIAESQMLKETEKIVQMSLKFLPLTANVNIRKKNALRIDWESVVPKAKLTYIMGNPPFVGARLMSPEQKQDLEYVFSGMKNYGNLDYVSGWFVKAAEFMEGTNIQAALVSTNSITQGEQVPLLWKNLNHKGIVISFAHRTFRWDSEAKLKAHVHCVIIGFSYQRPPTRKLYTSGRVLESENINAYLLDGPNIIIDSRKSSICNVPGLVFGSMPNDGGHLSDYSDEEKQEIVRNYPIADSMFRPFLGATEFLHGKKRWCLWLDGVSPADIKKVKPVLDAVAAVRKMREESKRESTRKLAATAYLFGEIRQPDQDYIIIPRHSSENRKYIPMGFVPPDIICGDSNLLLPNASLYLFGVLSSNVHNAWMRTVCGRLEMRYRYSVNVVYNTFPWPTPTDAQKAKIEQTAKAILDARALYPDASLADLYDDLTMPPELNKAHIANNKAVMAAYGFDYKTMGETDCVAELMRMYQALTQA